MKRVLQIGVLCLGSLAAGQPAWADDEERKNWGNDPFIKISTAIPGCPQPLGPLLTEKEWRGQADNRAERGNSCWLAGRCRLSNAYRHDTEIAETVQRRLTAMSDSAGGAINWQEKSTLWLTLQRRFILVHGCVSADFDKNAFVAALAETADVDTVVDQTIVGTSASPVPYELAAPAGAAAAPR
jgi:hypothetical protein